jgi:hypothetical protein
MTRRVPREEWTEEASTQFAALARWREAHPTATWDELEAAVEAELRPLRERLLGDLAMASGATAPPARPTCAQCGTAMQSAGTRSRRVHGERDLVVELDRTYLRCPACGAGFFPPRPGTGAAAGEVRAGGASPRDAAGEPAELRGSGG